MLLKTVLFAVLATAVCADPVDYTNEAIIGICNRNNATDKLEQVKALLDEYKECYPKIEHIDELPAAFNEAQNGTENEVAGKFCVKASETKACMTKVNHALALCLKFDETNILFIISVPNSARDYMCHEEDGKTRLAKFAADGGMRCITSRPENFSRCRTTPSMNMKADFEKSGGCVIDELKACSNSAALRMQGMFEYIRKGLPSGGINQLIEYPYFRVASYIKQI